MEYILEANNIEKEYGHFKALNNLSMHIPKGAIYGLIGKKWGRKNYSNKVTLWFTKSYIRRIYYLWYF